MNNRPDLSIILPVRDASDSIVARLRLLLDILTGLTTQFEIVVVDDASVDQTVEILTAFARDFRQISVRRHRASLGIMSAIQTGWSTAAGKSIYVQDPQLDVSAAHIKQFHDSGCRNNFCQNPPPTPASAVEDKLLARLAAWSNELKRVHAVRQKSKIDSKKAELTRIDPAASATRSPQIAVTSNRRAGFLQD